MEVAAAAAAKKVGPGAKMETPKVGGRRRRPRKASFGSLFPVFNPVIGR